MEFENPCKEEVVMFETEDPTEVKEGETRFNNVWDSQDEACPKEG